MHPWLPQLLRLDGDYLLRGLVRDQVTAKNESVKSWNIGTLFEPYSKNYSKGGNALCHLHLGLPHLIWLSRKMCFSICVCWVQEDTAHAIPCDGRARQQCCVSWRGVLGGETRIDVLLRSVVRLCRHGGRGAGGGPLPRCRRSCPMRAAIGGGQEPSRDN